MISSSRTLLSIEEKCREFLNKEYNIDLNIPIKINNRLTRTLGRFIVTRDDINNRIEFAGFLLKHGTDEQVMSVIKHECIHYALYSLGRDYKDGQKDFENELLKHNSDSTGQIRIKRKNEMVLDKDLSDKLKKTLEKTVRKVFDDITQKKISKKLKQKGEHNYEN